MSNDNDDFPTYEGARLFVEGKEIDVENVNFGRRAEDGSVDTESSPPPPTLRSTRHVAAMKDTNPKDAAATTRIPLTLLSPIAKAEWALAQFAGFLKYGGWNWRAAGVRSSVYLSAMQRHVDAYNSGEEFDPIDGTHHLGNIMACAAILLDAKEAGKLTDDRPPRVGIRGTYARLEALAAKLIDQYRDRKPKHYTIDGDDFP